MSMLVSKNSPLPPGGGEGRVRKAPRHDPASPPHPGPLPHWGRGRILFNAAVLLVLALALAGCGKKGLPQAPHDEPNTYPRTYPSA
jgi:predicted small lipoprotein YifL